LENELEDIVQETNRKDEQILKLTQEKEKIIEKRKSRQKKTQENFADEKNDLRRTKNAFEKS